MPSHLILGTHNRKKAVELAELVAPIGLEVATLADVANPIEVVEDGTTFSDNARKKAAQQACHLKAWVLAEDSGLCVDALDGRPGVYSARFAGENATDDDNNRRLLKELADTAEPKRTAHYQCRMALSDPDGTIVAESKGRCSGLIRTEPVGTNGFGFDPLFEVIELHRTFGELHPAVKRVISHRARAMRAIVPQVVALLTRGTTDA